MVFASDKNNEFFSFDRDDAINSSYVSNVNVSGGSESDISMSSTSQNRSACGMVTPSSSRITPIRSMSLRERRSMDASWSENTTQIPENATQAAGSGGNGGGGGGSKYRMHARNITPVSVESGSPSAGNSSGAWTKSNQHSHPHVNLLHASEQHYHSSPIQQSPYQQQLHQYQQHSNSYCQQDISLNSSSQIDSSHSSMNSSWSSQNQSPMQPYYSAQQIYMRPRTNATLLLQQQQQLANSKRVPPEVPKRTSSITLQQRGYDPSGRAMRPNGYVHSL